MGTRHLIAVYSQGAYRVAQYGQWDGGPQAVGSEVLAFCRRLTTPGMRAQFQADLARCRFLRDDETTVIDLRERPQFSRDTSAGVLDMIATSTGEFTLSNSLDFAADSLFCEWGYVIDMDQGLLEMYRGFNKRALDPDVDRFALRVEGDDPHAVNAVSAMGAKEYQPIRMMASWSLDDLPERDEFEAAGHDPERDSPEDDGG